MSILASALASAVGAFAAAWLGILFVLPRLRKERAFDRRLAWYEKAVALLLAAANKVNWAVSADFANRSEEDVRAAWADAMAALLALRGLGIEAEMFATPKAVEAVQEAMADISTLAQTIGWAQENVASPNEMQAQLFTVCWKSLLHAASRLATDVRAHLKLEPYRREVRLYDDAHREAVHRLREEQLGQDKRAGRIVIWP